MPKISVIIPVYNMENYLEQSLSSWANQTLHDIEIICIDDASPDGSYAVLQQWAKKDSRFIVHHFEQNSSAWMARKIGIQLARGEYILFADADDEIALTACEELYHEATRDPVDILHFGTKIVNVNNLPEARIENMYRLLNPYDGRLMGDEVFSACFVDKKYGFTIWNKLFSADLCKRAAEKMKDAVLPKAQDKLAYFILAHMARSYRGLPNTQYYSYYFGRGGTGHNYLNMNQFKRYCTMGLVADSIRNYAAENSLDEKVHNAAKIASAELLNDCLSRWLNELPDKAQAQGFDLMLCYWQRANLIEGIAKKMNNQRYRLAQTVRSAHSLVNTKRETKTIATYYHSCINGGVQRVLSQLCDLWIGMGYRVVLMTDLPSSENDYTIHPDVKHVVIPSFEYIKAENYAERARAIEQIIMENEIDTVVYHAWIAELLPWDALTIKSSGASLVIHCHSVFSYGFLSGWRSYRPRLAPYLLADAVVTLSAADCKFWKHFNNNVFETLNPFTDGIDQWSTSTSLDSHDILWVGRIAEEKNPYDLIRIMTHVVRQIPDAKLHIIGESKNPNYEKGFRDAIVNNKLSEHIIMHGFHVDVKPFYQNASIYLMTSSYEGYGLTLQESKLAGLPCVMYELPYLTLCQGNRGIIPVRQKDATAAANALIELMQDADLRKKLGSEARKHVEELFEFDFEGLWKNIFHSLTLDHAPAVTPDEQIMMETIMTHYEAGTKPQSVVVGLPDDYNIHNYGRFVRYCALIERGFRSLKAYGFMFTLKKTVTKILKHFK